MKFLVTACLLSERLKPRPKAEVTEFFKRNKVLIPFATFLTIERGLELLARTDKNKALALRSQFEALITEHETFQGSDRAIAQAMAKLLSYGPLRHIW